MGSYFSKCNVPCNVPCDVPCNVPCDVPYNKNIEYIKISINTDEQEYIHIFIIDKYLCENFIKWTSS